METLWPYSLTVSTGSLKHETTAKRLVVMTEQSGDGSNLDDVKENEDGRCDKVRACQHLSFKSPRQQIASESTSSDGASLANVVVFFHNLECTQSILEEINRLW